MKKSEKFNRTRGTKRYKKLFVLSVEGEVTEPRYFKLLESSDVHIKIIDRKHSQPSFVLDAMKKYLEKSPLQNADKAWLVIDKDNWENTEINKLCEWSKQDNYGLALSNPCFEYWLLLHFEDGNGILTLDECRDRLKKYLPAYSKDIDATKFSEEQIKQAIERAKKRDTPPCIDWPKEPGTTVYKLIENMLM